MKTGNLDAFFREKCLTKNIMPQGHSCAEGVPTASLLPNQKKMLSEINAGYGRKGESYHGDISLYSKDCRTQ